jgi:predicted DNA-binding transcriptional regulator AlpA
MRSGGLCAFARPLGHPKTRMTVITIKKNQSAQVEPARMAAAMKAANEAKWPQPHWLQTHTLTAPASETPLSPERVNEANRSQGPPRLLDRHEVCAVANVSYPTIWTWMRAGRFPRSRIVGGKSMWLSTEIEAWMSALPVRALKGDAE